MTSADRVETIEVKDDEEGLRLDRWFRIHFPDRHLHLPAKAAALGPGSRRQQARRGQCTGWTWAPQIRVPKIAREPAKPGATTPAGRARSALSKGDRDCIERMILFEDEHVLVLNKPFGLAVQGGTGTKRHIDGMLAGMVDRFGDRPRLVHRLDRDTTGVLLVAKTSRCRRQARPHLSDPLGGQDLLGAGEGRAEAAAGQDRGGAGQSLRPRRRPRAQGAAGRADGGDARHHALLGHRPHGAQGVVGQR